MNNIFAMCVLSMSLMACGDSDAEMKPSRTKLQATDAEPYQMRLAHRFDGVNEVTKTLFKQLGLPTPLLVNTGDDAPGTGDTVTVGLDKIQENLHTLTIELKKISPEDK